LNSFVTLVTNPDYVIGARALARSLKMCQSQWPLTVLAVENLDGLELLEAMGCRVIQVEPLPLSDDFRARHSRQQQHQQAPFTKGNKPVFHDPLHNFVKLRLWEMDEHEKVVFLDADTLVIQNIDRLFEYPEFAAAPNLYESLADFHRLNSGVFVAKPNRQRFEDMLDCLDRPDVFWKRTDQTFLETYFPDWHGLPYIYNTLQYVWLNLPQLWDWNSIRVIHYQYEKPWEENNPKRAVLRPVIDVWQHVFEFGEMPDDLPNPG
jgi:alpha-N-acetylglucosamine transferase